MVACKKRPVHPQSGSRLYHPWSQSKLNIKSGLCSEFRHASTPSEYNLLCEPIGDQVPMVAALCGLGGKQRSAAGGSHGTNGSLPFHFFLRCPPSQTLDHQGKTTQKGEGNRGRQKCVIVFITPFSSTPTRQKFEIFLSFATSRLFHISCIRFVVVVFDVYLCSLTFVKSLELHMVKLWNFLRNLQARSTILRVSTLCVPPTHFLAQKKHWFRQKKILFVG